MKKRIIDSFETTAIGCGIILASFALVWFQKIDATQCGMLIGVASGFIFFKQKDKKNDQ